MPYTLTDAHQALVLETVAKAIHGIYFPLDRVRGDWPALTAEQRNGYRAKGQIVLAAIAHAEEQRP